MSESSRKSDLGRLGEDMAADFLQKKGCRIIERNYRVLKDEIDLIVRDKQKTLIFVEVKTMNLTADGRDPAVLGLVPEDQLTSAKRKKIYRSARLFAGHHNDLIREDRGWRVDLVAVQFSGDSHTIKHYENI